MAEVGRSLYPVGLQLEDEPEVGGELLANEVTERMIAMMSGDGGIAINNIGDTGLRITDSGAGTVVVAPGYAFDKLGQLIDVPASDDGHAIVTGNDLTGGIDLSVNFLIKLDVDNAGPVEIDLQGSTPAATTATEIVDLINDSGAGAVAYLSDVNGVIDSTGTYVTLRSFLAGASSEIEFQAPSATDATNAIFGVTPVDTTNGGGNYTIPTGGEAHNVVIEYLVQDSVIGSFAAGFPTTGVSPNTKRENSYKITVTTDDPIRSSTQHQLLLATAENNSGTLTLVDKRGDSRLRLIGSATEGAILPPILINLPQELSAALNETAETWQLPEPPFKRSATGADGYSESGLSLKQRSWVDTLIDDSTPNLAWIRIVYGLTGRVGTGVVGGMQVSSHTTIALTGTYDGIELPAPKANLPPGAQISITFRTYLFKTSISDLARISTSIPPNKQILSPYNFLYFSIGATFSIKECLPSIST